MINENIKYYNKVLNNKKIKFTTRIFYFFPWGIKLTDFYRKHKYLNEKVLGHKTLITKLNRPYIATDLKIKEKLKMIIGSYKFLDENFNDEFLEILYKNEIIEISNFKDKTGETYRIYLNIFHECSKEGEIQLVLVNDENMRISKLTFSVLNENFYIGSIQGSKEQIDPEIIKNTIKNLYGERTQKIILSSLFNLKEILNLKGEIFAVSGEMHFFNDKRYSKSKNIKNHEYSIFNSYNKFWSSVHGKLYNSFYKLPKKLIRKEIEDVKSKKRNLYKNRYDLLDELGYNMNIFFSGRGTLKIVDKKEIKFL